MVGDTKQADSDHVRQKANMGERWRCCRRKDWYAAKLGFDAKVRQHNRLRRDCADAWPNWRERAPVCLSNSTTAMADFKARRAGQATSWTN